MKRVTPKSPFAYGEAPRPQINCLYVYARLKEADRLDHEEQVVSFLDRTLAKYVRAKAIDEASATPAKVRDFADRLVAVLAELHPQDKHEDTILRAVIDPFEFADLTCPIEEVVERVRAIQGEIGKGSGPRPMHARQVELAKWFWQGFEENGWPTGTSQGSLMAQLLRVVLMAVDEDRGTKQLLLEAKPAA